MEEENKETPTQSGFKLTLPMSILIAAALISGSVFYYAHSMGTAQIGATPQPKNYATPTVDDDPMLGNPNAKVTIIEFSDFECPFCRSFWRDTFSSLKKDYIDTGKVRLVYRDYPLSFHPSAQPGAEAANCTNEQGKFWEFHDKIFSELDKQGPNTVEFSTDQLKLWAKQIGVNTQQFNSCLDANKYQAEIAKDQSDGNDAGVSGTPTFYINGQQLVGAQPYSVFKQVIDQLLK